MIDRWKPAPGTSRICFISDLHLFSDRSNFNEHLASVEAAIESADLCIWGGDLFDFRWNQLQSEQLAVSQAIEWIENWVRRYPRKTFLYVDGNHDANVLFRASLRRWANDEATFHCGFNCLRVADTLFIHGDVIEGRGTTESFREYRLRWEQKPTASKLARRAYDAAIAIRAHQVAAMAAHRQRATCLRLLQWMQQQPQVETSGVKRIAFGHTHRKLHDYQLGGIRFYNGGASIRHVPFQPVVLEI